MSDLACTFERFEQDSAYHWMEIIRDDGVNRHIRFRRHGSSTYWFDLITWPGTLCIDGDCGTYVFRRTHDMFRFFNNRAGQINPQYWSEKVEAADRDGVRKFDSALFEENVKEWLEDWISRHPFRDDNGRFLAGEAELRNEVEDEVLNCSEQGEDTAVRAACDFKWHGKMLFQDFWEVNNKAYTFSYLWCCHAIVWGIQTYDAHHANRALANLKILTSRAGFQVAA